MNDLSKDISIIRETILEWSKAHKRNGPGYGPRALIVAAIYEVELIENSDGKSHWQYDHFYADMFARDAQEHWDVNKLYRDVVASKLIAGAQLFTEERNFAAGFLTEELPVPRQPKANKLEDNFSRNLLILNCVDILVKDHRLNRFQSENTKSNTPNASTIVSEAFQNAGHNEVTISTIKGVLQNKNLAPWIEKVKQAKRAESLKVKVLAAEHRSLMKRLTVLYAEFGGLSQQ